MKIYLGPAGIPIRSQERSTVAGIRAIRNIGLNAMEVEFVRGVKMALDEASKVGRLASQLGVILSVHAPYFVNLCNPEKRAASEQRILAAVERAHYMGAKVCAFHPGYYGKLPYDEAFQMVKGSCQSMISRIKNQGWDAALGLETMGKQSQFGTLQEIVKICEEVEGCVPVVDWAHIYARQGGRIDFGAIFDMIEPLRLFHIHSHFTCVEFSSTGVEGQGNEKRHLTLDRKEPDFEPLVAEILKRGIDITLICESPILEDDALALKELFERHGYKFT